MSFFYDSLVILGTVDISIQYHDHSEVMTITFKCNYITECLEIGNYSKNIKIKGMDWWPGEINHWYSYKIGIANCINTMKHNFLIPNVEVR